jgi:hypothetical protein
MLLVALVVMCAVSGGCSRLVNAGDSKANILRLVFSASDPELTTGLKESVAVLPDPASDPAELAKVYRAAADSAHMPRLILSPGHSWTIVAAGPLLDSPDEAVVKKAELDGRVFQLEVVYTSTRLRGGQLRRNVAWRPLLTMPVGAGVPTGDYQVQVNWQPLESLPSGKAIGNPRNTGPLFFTVAR